MFGFASEAQSAFYSGKNPGRWQAQLRVKNERVVTFHLSGPILCRDGEKGWTTWIAGSDGVSRVKVRIKSNGKFRHVERSPWGKNILRGRVTRNRIRGSFYTYDNGGGYQEPCRTGRKGDHWVNFNAPKRKPSASHRQ